MSIPKRMFEDPVQSYVVDNGDPGAFDKRYAGVVGTHREQRCCGDRSPYWDSHRVESALDNTQGQRLYLASDPQGLPPGGNPYAITASTPLRPGDVLIEGPASEYRPSWVTPESWYGDWQGLRWVKATTTVQGLPSPGHWAKDDNAPTKMRWGSWGGWEFLWCSKCETGAEKVWSDAKKVIPIAARGIAAIVSYFPVYGTAISFAINATVTYAETGSIEQAVLDGIGGSLPGQPESKAVFDAGVAIAKGERADKVLLGASMDLAEVPREVQRVVFAADDIIYGIATGQSFDDIAYDTVLNQLQDSPEAQRAMGYAYRIAHGENVPELILSEAEQEALNRVKEEAQGYVDAAQAKGEAALGYAREKAESRLKQYAMETGYQVALMSLPVEMRDAVTTGIVVGVYEKSRQLVGTFGHRTEQTVSREANDAYAAKGQAIVNGAAGGTRLRVAANAARYKGLLLSDMLKAPTVQVTVTPFSALTQQYEAPRLVTYSVDDLWRRGFLIAIGYCEGKSQPGPLQDAVRRTLDEASVDGFDAGQAVQFWRTVNDVLVTSVAKTSAQDTAANAMLQGLGQRPVVLPTAKLPSDASATLLAVTAVGRVTVDAGARVALTDAGDALIAGSQGLQAAKARVSAQVNGDWATLRGFSIGVAVAWGPPTPWTASQVRAGLANDGTTTGFDVAMQLAKSASSPPVQAQTVPFTFHGTSPSDIARMEVAVKKDILRLSWVRYYQAKKAQDLSVVH